MDASKKKRTGLTSHSQARNLQQIPLHLLISEENCFICHWIYETTEFKLVSVLFGLHDLSLLLLSVIVIPFYQEQNGFFVLDTLLLDQICLEEGKGMEKDVTILQYETHKYLKLKLLKLQVLACVHWNFSLILLLRNILIR